MREFRRGRRRLLVWAVGLALAGSVQGQESPKRQTDEPLVLHMRVRHAYRSTGRLGQGHIRRHGQECSVAAHADGHHHLRHVEPALVPGGHRAESVSWPRR